MIRQLRHDIITSHHECEATPTEAPQPMSARPALFTYNVTYVILYINNSGLVLIGWAKLASEISDFVTWHMDQ